MSNKHEFLLPDELGWECNDEISQKINEIIQNDLKHINSMPIAYWRALLVAEIMDETYAIIKKYLAKHVRALKK